MKYIFYLLAALLVLTSCGEDPATTMPMSYVPTGIMVLAYIGMITCILLVFLLILFFGGIVEYFTEDKD